MIHEIEFGGVLARKLARPQIPNEANSLEDIAQSLVSVPGAGSKAKPVWAALCNFSTDVGSGDKRRLVRANRLRALLKQGFQLDPKGIRRFVAVTLLEHLQWITRTHMGPFRAAMLTGRNICQLIARLAEGDRDRARCYRQIHRTARHNREVVRALNEFFFQGLPSRDLRARPDLFAKLLPALKKDVSLLVRFLYQNKSKGRLGFIPHCLKIDAPGSQFRRKLVMHQTWPERVLLYRDGRKDADLSAEADRLAGVPLTELRRKGYVVAAEKLRRDEGLRYPK